MPLTGINKSEEHRTGRVQNDEEPKNNVKFDYSGTYYENDILELSLESKLSHLHKAKYKSGLDRENSFKVAKKAAEDIQSLSQAIRRGSIPSSITLYKQTEKIKREHTFPKMDENVDKLTDAIKDLNTTNNEQPGVHYSETDDVLEHALDSKPKVGNTLTMFALSLHKFSSSIGRHSESRQNPQIMKKRSYSARALPHSSQRKDMSRFRRSARSVRQNLRDGEALDVLGDVPTLAYGKEAQKKRTQSRRQLQELSKIEQRETFDFPNKPEDRRRRLYEWAKGDLKSLDFRIQRFINDVEDFKRRNRQSDIEINPSLFSNS